MPTTSSSDRGGGPLRSRRPRLPGAGARAPVPPVACAGGRRREPAPPARARSSPKRYDLTLDPGPARRPRSRAPSTSTSRCTSRPPRWCSTPSSSRSTRPGWSRATHRRDADGRPRRGDRAGSPSPSPSRSPPGDAVVSLALPGDPQRQAARLLPLHLHRRRRRRARHRHHPVRGHRRPPGLPVLGRARLQGRASPSPCVDAEPHRRLQRRRSCPTRPRRRPRRGPLRRHDGDVDLPGGLHRRPARGHRAGRRRRHARCASSTRPGKGHLTAFGLEVGAFSLRYLADYFDIPYPGDTIDLVAIPDFAFGAMENLGCVTFRETLLLVDPEHATQGELQNVVDVIAHELAHMWFGDLVTMKLVERHLAQRGLRHVHGDEGHRRLPARVGALGRASACPAPPAFDTDALDATRPIEFPVVSPGRRRGHVRRPHLREGRRRRAHARAVPRRGALPRRHPPLPGRPTPYGNTETTDLWDAIEEATGEPVRRIMDSWIFQGGHPIVSVEAPATTAGVLHSQPGALPLPARPEPTRPAGRCPSSCATAPTSRRGRHDHGAARRRRRSRSTSPSPSPGWSATPRATASTGCAPSAPLREALVEPGAGASCPTSSATASSTTPGRRCWPAPPTPEDVPRAGRAASPTRPTCRCGAGSSAALDRARPVLADGDRAARSRPGSARSSARPSSGSAGSRAPASRPRPRAARRADRRRGHPRRRPRRRAPGRASCSPRYAPTRTSVEANVAGAVRAGRRRRRRRRRGRRDPRPASATAARRRRSCATCSRWPRSATRRCSARCSSWPSPPRCAPRTRRTCSAPASPTATTAPLAWARVRERWDEINERFPSNSIVRMLDGIRAVADPTLAADVEAFLAEHPVPQAKQTVAQHLERMQVTVALARARGRRRLDRG